MYLNPFLVEMLAKERMKDVLREAEWASLIRAAKLRRPRNWRLYREVAGWIGAQNARAQVSRDSRAYQERWGGSISLPGMPEPAHFLKWAAG